MHGDIYETSLVKTENIPSCAAQVVGTLKMTMSHIQTKMYGTIGHAKRLSKTSEWRADRGHVSRPWKMRGWTHERIQNLAITTSSTLVVPKIDADDTTTTTENLQGNMNVAENTTIRTIENVGHVKSPEISATGEMTMATRGGISLGELPLRL